MNLVTPAAALALALGLAACGQSDETLAEVRETSTPAASPVASLPADMGRTSSSMPMSSAAEADREYTATGEVTAVDGDKVTISHGPVEGIGWPAMTMGFKASKEQVAAVMPGDQVAFAFRQAGADYVVTSLTAQPR